MNGFAITAEQRSLLSRRNHSLKPLTTSGHLSIWQVFSNALLPLGGFFFTLVVSTSAHMFLNERMVLYALIIGNACLVLKPFLALCTIIYGMAVTKGLRWSAAVYWAWWPFWKFALCAGSVGAASTVGSSIWTTSFQPYFRMQSSQSYNNINPEQVSGIRMQDAGVVVFDATAGVDRGNTGCLKNGGTYCVAPILIGDSLSVASTSSTTVDGITQHHDLFMAGTDCCTCPGEFRCGAWNVPMANIGGMRIVNPDVNAFYRLAAEGWSVTHGKQVVQPIFFEWVKDPGSTWDGMWTRGVHLMTMSLIMAPFGCIGSSFLLNGIFRALHSGGYIAPLDTPMPPGGLGQGLTKRLLPQMHSHYNEQLLQQGVSNLSAI